MTFRPSAADFLRGTEASMHDEERHGDGDGSAIQLEGDNEEDRRSSATKRDLFYK